MYDTPKKLSHCLKIREGSITPDPRPCYHPPVSHVCVGEYEKVGRGDCRRIGGKAGADGGMGEVGEWSRRVRPGTRIENSSHFVADDG